MRIGKERLSPTSMHHPSVSHSKLSASGLGPRLRTADSIAADSVCSACTSSASATNGADPFLGPPLLSLNSPKLISRTSLDAEVDEEAKGEIESKVEVEGAASENAASPGATPSTRSSAASRARPRRASSAVRRVGRSGCE